MIVRHDKYFWVSVRATHVMCQMLEVLKQIELQSGASVTIDQSTKDHFLLIVAQLWHSNGKIWQVKS